MHRVTCQLTIIFDGSFYRAIFESHNQNTYSVYQKILGTTDPKLPMLEHLILKHYYEFSFSSGIQLPNSSPYHQKTNPKRLQRKASRKENSISTKAQKALQQQREEIKSARQLKKKKNNQQQKQKKFNQKQEKKRLKKRGR